MRNSRSQQRRTLCLLSSVISMQFAISASADTLAYWRFEGDGTVVPGTTQVEDTNGRNLATTYPNAPGVAVIDSSGNGNTLRSWEHSFAGHTYQSSVPSATIPLTGAANNLSVQNAGSFPAMFTWSLKTAPTRDVETIKPNTWTIEASVRSTDISGNRTFVGRDGNRDVGTSDPARAPLYFKTLNGTLQILFTDEAGNTYDLSDPSGAMSVNTWYNVAAVSDGTTLKLYKDAGAGYSLVNSMPLVAGDTRMGYDDGGSTTANDTQWGWTVGRGRYGASTLQGDGHADRWFGNIDEVRISDAALNPNQFLFYTVPTPSNLTWKGGLNGDAWDLDTTANFDNNTKKFKNGDSVTFDNTGSSTAVITGGLAAGTITINGTNSLTLSGTGGVSAANAQSQLIKNSTGTLTIANGSGNSFGAININAGTVELADTAVFGARPLGGSTIVNNGVILINRPTTGLFDCTFVDGNISGTGSLIVAKSLAASGSNSFDGNVIIKTGATFFSDNQSALGSNVGTTTIEDGATLGIYLGNYTIGEKITLGGAGQEGSGAIKVGGGGRIITLTGDLTMTSSTTFAAEGATSTLSLNGNLSGAAFDISKIGPGVVAIAGNASFTNATINAGALQIGNGGTLGNMGSGNVNLNTGTLQFGRTDTLNFTNYITGVGNVFNVGTGTTELTNPVNDFFGNVGATNGMLILSQPTAATAVTASGNGVVRVANASAVVFASTVNVLSNNAETGGLEVAGGLTDLFASSAIAISGRNNASSAIRSFSGNNSVSGSITLNAGGSQYQFEAGAASSLQIGGPITVSVASTRNIVVAGAGVGTMSSVLSNGSAATLTVNKTGAGTWTLEGANTYNGNTTVNGGTLIVKSAAQAPIFTGAGADVKNGYLVLEHGADGGAMATNVKAILKNSHDTPPAFSTDKIRSSTADATKGLGWKDAATGTTVGYAYYGDANLDGTVSSTDFAALAGKYGTTAGAIWVDGDFNYDGKVNTLDFNDLAGNFGLTIAPPAAPVLSLGAAVPEPASLSLLAMAGAGLLSRRSRKH